MHPFLCGTLITTLYIAVAVGIMFIARKLINIPDELFRKILHFILLGAYIPLCFAFEAWWMATVYALSLIVILFPFRTIRTQQSKPSLFFRFHASQPSKLSSRLTMIFD